MWQAILEPFFKAAFAGNQAQEARNAQTREQLMAMNQGQDQQPALQRFTSQNQGGMSPEALGALAGLFKVGTKKKQPTDVIPVQAQTEAQGPMSVMGGDPSNSSQMYDPNAWTNYLR